MMMLNFRSACILGVALVTLPAALAAGPVSASFDGAALDHGIAERMKTGAAPGAAIAMVLADGTIVERDYGRRSAETGDKVIPGTLFRVGSMTKPWVAAALLKVLEDKKIPVDRPIGDYVSGLHRGYAHLTVHQLLSHTSGMADSNSTSQRLDEATLAARFAEAPPEDAFFAPPGRIMSYSNAGFALAGLILEQLTGKPFAESLDTLVMAPIGASRTTFRPLVAMTYPVALGHEKSSADSFVVSRPVPFDAASAPSGAAYASAEDAARFARLLLRGGKAEDGSVVLSPAIVKAMTTPHAVTPDSAGTTHYGYGLFLEGTEDYPYWFHGGGLDGYNSSMTIRPAANIAAVALVNGSDGGLAEDLKSIAVRAISPPRKAASTAAAATPSAKAPAELPAALADELVGDWRQGAWRFAVRKEGSALVYLLDGKPLGTLRYAGSDMFDLVGASGDSLGPVAAVRGDDGRVDFLAWSGRASARVKH